MKSFISMDTETTLIGIDNIIPDIICSSFHDLSTPKPFVKHWSPKDEHVAYLSTLFNDTEQHLIYHNAPFDLAVLSKYEWSLLPSIWEALEQGRIHDTMTREQLLNLTMYGSIDIIEQHGIKSNVTYSLAALVLKYLNIDIKEEKDAEDSVRVNYEAVRYAPLSEWPKEYVEYAEKDALYTGMVFLEQEKARRSCIERTGYDPFVKEGFIVTYALGLYYMTAQGNLLDKERVLSVTKEFLDRYNDDELVWPLVHSSWIQKCQQREPRLSASKLIEYARKEWDQLKDQKYWEGSGLVIPAVPPLPNKRGTKEHLESCVGHKMHPLYNGKAVKNCDCPVGMNQPQPERGSDIALHAHIWRAAQRNPDIRVWLSDGYKEKMKKAGLDAPHPVPHDFIMEHDTPPELDLGGAKPERMLVKVDKEWLATFASLDPVLEIYNERHKIQKIVTSYLPTMYWADGYKTACPMVMDGETDKLARKQPAERVHAQFASLKETGRTSSYAAKKKVKGSGEVVLYPSFNIQQVDPRIRQCIIPEKGNLLGSSDYSAMELCTAAQTAYNLLGYEGVLMKLINAGKDTHSYLGVQIAIALDPEFTSAWGLSADQPERSYDMFMAVKKNKDECDSPVFRGIFEECYLGKKWGDHVVTWNDCTMAQYFKHFRTFGKPTGLGFWGGLGEPTFVSMARATYGIPVDIEIAKVLRGIWRTYIPEGQQYLDFVNKQMIDRLAEPEVIEGEDGKMKKRNFYCYDTPLGMHRAKCTYTSAANGCALQSPSAEGALGAVAEIMKECTVGGLAGFVFPSGFIHDELFYEIVHDEETTNRVRKIEEIMVRNMQTIATPNVKASVESALMYRWNKKAEPVWKDGKLIPWEPEA